MESGAPWAYVCHLKVRQGRPAAPRGSRHILAAAESVSGHRADRLSSAARSPSVFGDIQRSLSRSLA